MAAWLGAGGLRGVTAWPTFTGRRSSKRASSTRRLPCDITSFKFLLEQLRGRGRDSVRERSSEVKRCQADCGSAPRSQQRGSNKRSAPVGAPVGREPRLRSEEFTAERLTESVVLKAPAEIWEPHVSEVSNFRFFFGSVLPRRQVGVFRFFLGIQLLLCFFPPPPPIPDSNPLFQA